MASSSLRTFANNRWEPLPKILYGFSIFPFSPSASASSSATAPTTKSRPSGRARDDQAETPSDPHLVDLAVGDEVYAFERYRMDGPSGRNMWYRGYVVSTARTGASISPTPSEPNVFLGVFPASFVYVRDELDDAEGRLSATSVSRDEEPGQHPSGLAVKGKSKTARMEIVAEEEEEGPSSRTEDQGLPADGPTTLPSNGSILARSGSARKAAEAASDMDPTWKPPPPVPSLKAGDETARGSTEPLVDEIACALREWHARMFQYLVRRDYALFDIVQGHALPLHQARRKLLDQTLGSEELDQLRAECVSRLVRGNVAQGLDVIVRHPLSGGLATTSGCDGSSEVHLKTFLGPTRLFSAQVASAYLDPSIRKDSQLSSDKPRTQPSSLPSLPSRSSIVPSPRQPPTRTISNQASASQVSLLPAQGAPSKSSEGVHRSADFHHVFIELGAFVATPCHVGETAELFFALYSKSLRQFVSEESLVVLNHHGAPLLTLDGSQDRARILFMDLGAQDMSDLVLVCRIVRCGALKMSAVGTAPVPSTSTSSHRAGSPADEVDSTEPLASPTNGQLRKASTAAPPFRRPFGCATIDISSLPEQSSASALSDVALSDMRMRIYIPSDEAGFASLHEDIIFARSDRFERSPRADLIVVHARSFYGQIASIRQENPQLLRAAVETQRLSFQDVVYPGQTRNDLYIKLWSGEFGHATGSSSFRRRGIGSIGGSYGLNASSSCFQVNVELRTRQGVVLDQAISRGTGEDAVRSFSSIVFKSATSTFGELLKVHNLPPDVLSDCHLFFTVRQRSPTRERAPTSDALGLERAYAFAYLPLVPAGAGVSFLPDGDHHLLVYKCDKAHQIAPASYFDLPSVLVPGSAHLDGFKLPSSASKSIVPIRDRLTIRSYLCSTSFTKSDVLLRLIGWEKAGLLDDVVELTSTLKQLAFVPEVEVVKVLHALFDALFGIIAANPEERVTVEGLVFQALVNVLGLVQDRRFTNFAPVVDLYIDEAFSWTIWKALIRSMSALLVDKNSKQLRAAIKVWHLIFRFIMRAREIQKDKDRGLGGTSELLSERLDSSFKTGLSLLLQDFDELMKLREPPSIIGTQTLALQHFSDILPDLVSTFNPPELSLIVVSFSDAAAVTGKAIIYKLLLHLRTVSSVAFDDADFRAALVPALVRWIKPHLGRCPETLSSDPSDSSASREIARLGWLEALRLSISILALMLDKLCDAISSPASRARAELLQDKDNVDLVFSCLPKLLESYQELQNPVTLDVIDQHRSLIPITSVPIVFPSSYPFALVAHAPAPPPSTLDSPEQRSAKGFNILLGEISAVILALLSLQPQRNLSLYLDEQLEVEGRENVSAFLQDFFRVATSILTHDAFPVTWINLSIAFHRSLLKFTALISAFMVANVPSEETLGSFDSSLWLAGLTMLFELLRSPDLSIESFGPQKRRAVWNLAGDIRGEAATILLQLWDAIGWPVEPDSLVPRFGRYQVGFLPLVPAVLSLCLSHHEHLRAVSVHVLFTMILSEWSLEGNFNRVESDIIDKLDFLTTVEGDLARVDFLSPLREMFVASGAEATLLAAVNTFLDSVDQFLELLIDLRGLPEGDEYTDDRTLGTLRLLNYLRRVRGKGAMYINYVHQLVDSQARRGDFTEAGLTLKLHASLYEWDESVFVDPFHFGDLSFPRQSHFGRKESLYLQTLDYLGRGKAYELAIDVCKELEYQHAHATFDYGRLAELLSHRSRLLESIVSEPRPMPQYFYVAYYGSDFPAALKARCFIYRGAEWEKLGGFLDKIHNKHPSAKIITSLELPDEARDGDELCIHLLSVEPEPRRELPVFSAAVPKEIRGYHETNNIDSFFFLRPFRKTSVPASGPMDIVNTWTEKTLLTCDETFPTVIRRAEVKSIRTVEMSSIRMALNDVVAKSAELVALEKRFSSLKETNQPVNTTSLSMFLNGAVDAPINGGVPLYRDAFYSASFLSDHPDQAPVLKELRDAIDAQTVIIYRSIVLHGEICPDSLSPFHATIVSFFHKTFSDEIARLGLPELPTVAQAQRSADFSPVANGHSLPRNSSFSASARPSISSFNTSAPLSSLPASSSTPHRRPPLSKAGNSDGSGPADTLQMGLAVEGGGSLRAQTLRALKLERSISRESRLSRIGSVLRRKDSGF